MKLNSFQRALAAAVTIFAASLIGVALQHVIPDLVLADAKAPVGAVTGLFTLLLALVLGLLVWTAFSVYSTQQAEAESLVPVVARIDALMSEYGPAALAGRAGLIASLERARVRFFGDRKRGPQRYTYEETRLRTVGMDSFFDTLQPANDRERRLLQSSRDLAQQLADTQNLMARQLGNPVPPFLLVVVVLWASALFFGNGLVAKANLIVIGAYLAGAAAVGSAIFLIDELSSPYTGVFRLSPAELDKVIAILKAEGKGRG